MKLLPHFETWILIFVTAMVSGAVSGLYLKLFNLAPPVSIHVIHLPVFMGMLAVLMIRIKDAFFGALVSIPFLLLAALSLISFTWSLNPMFTLREAMIGLIIGLYFGCVAWSYSWPKIIDVVWLSMFSMGLISLFLFR